MAIRRISPYIQCADGKAGEAIALYEKALGAEISLLMRYSDAPAEMNMPADKADLVMHAELRVGGEAFMVSDAMGECPAGGMGQVILDFADPGEMARAFDALAQGGKVVMPIADAFWGAKFGVLEDAFGMRWSLNCQVGGE